MSIAIHPMGMENIQHRSGYVRRNDLENWVPFVAGGTLIAFGIGSRDKVGIAIALLGGGVLWSGLRRTGDVADTAAPRGFHVQKSITVNAEPDELYRFWRKFENLPTFMKYLESVHAIDDRRSHWVAKAPAGMSVEWDAEITAEQVNRRISWTSIAGSEVDNAGSVEFKPAPAGRGTEVHVSIMYNPPGGVLGKTIAMLFGKDPAWQVQEDLRRFKQLIEAGEIPTTQGQTSGRAD